MLYSTLKHILLHLLCSYHSAMKEVFLRFGHIGDQIFEELDSQTLSKCRLVGKPWKLFLDHGKVQQFRIIKTYTNIDEKNLRKYKRKINVVAVRNKIAITFYKIESFAILKEFYFIILINAFTSNSSP